jgi:plasmid maintenance system antidote protein VapI
MKFDRQEKNPLLEFIADRLKEFEWKPVDLARHANVHQSVVSRLLNDSKQISVDNIYKILKALGASPGEPIKSRVKLIEAAEPSEGYGRKISGDHSKEIEFLREQVRFYKEKATFFEFKCTDLKRRLLSGKRADDPEDLDVKNLRKLINGGIFPYGFNSE